jgi:hypothetical protein
MLCELNGVNGAGGVKRTEDGARNNGMIRMNPFGILDELLGNGWMTDFGAKSEF